MDLSTKLLETSNYYEIFSLPAGWQIDRPLLDSRYRQLQREFHPDRFATKGDVEKRLAVQTTSLINQAYENMGMRTSQMLGTFFDGITRHTEEAYRWTEDIAERGFKPVIADRDGPWQDYGQRP